MMKKKVKARRKSAEVRRHDVIAAALDIIRKQGVDKLTTRALSQAVGIAQPTLFLHFGNKPVCWCCSWTPSRRVCRRD